MDLEQLIEQLNEELGENTITTASNINRPEPKPQVKEIEMFNDFNTRNPMAGGGMLVKPSADGSRPGYKDDNLPTGIKLKAKDKYESKVAYVDNTGAKQHKYVGTYKTLAEAKKQRLKAIEKIEKELKIEKGELFGDTRLRTSKNLLPKNKKNYISIKQLKDLLGVVDLKPTGTKAAGSSTSIAKAASKLLDQTKVTSAQGADAYFYKNPTKKELDLLKTYVGKYKIREDMLERIKNLQKDKYTAKILKDGKLPMDADGILDDKFLKHVSDNYGTLDKYVHGLVRYTQALDGQRIIGLNDPILSDGKFKTNKNLSNKIVNVFLETPYGSSNASQNTIRKAVYKAAMNDITNELGNTDVTFENFKERIRNKINREYNLKKAGVEIDELIGVSSSFRNKTAPYSVFTQLTTEKLNQGILKDYQKVVSNYTAQLKNEINKNSKFIDGKWQHSKKAKDIVNNFNTNILPNLKNIDQLKGTNVKLPELTLGSPTDKTLGGTKGRLNQLENMGLNFRDFYKAQGFGYKMPLGAVTQKEIVSDPKILKGQINNILKQLKAGNVKGVENALKQTGVKSKEAGFISRELLESAAKGIGNVGRVLSKYGILPEAGFLGADYLVRTQLGDSPKEAFLRATDFYRPGDQTKEAEILETSRFFGDKAGQIVGRVIDYEKQLAKIESLKQQKQSLESLSPSSGFGYIADTSKDIKNIDNQLQQATFDLNNKFNVTEAERTYANRIREEADDARMATSNVAKTRLERSQSPSYRMSAPQAMKDMRSQMDLNLDMLPTMPRNLMKARFSDILNYAQQLKAAGYDVSSKDILEERDRLKNLSMEDLSQTYSPEQVYGAQGTFFGQPLAGGGIAKIAGIDQGPQRTSMNPDSGGLKGILKRAMKLKE